MSSVGKLLECQGDGIFFLLTLEVQSQESEPGGVLYPFSV